MALLWGIDLGGTKIEGIVVDADAGYAVVSRRRIPTEQSGGYAHILARIGQVVDLLAQETGRRPEVLGIGTPGALDPDAQAIKNSNTTCLIGQPLKTDLERLLGVELRMANDANCFALAEARLGAAAGRVSEAGAVFGVIMGTGVGGGVVVHGRVLEGRHGIAGEWGHNYLDDSGSSCYCGRRGCVETILAGPALERFYAARAGAARKLPDIYARHLAGGDPDASATIDRLIHFFGKALAVVINILDPEAIVLGGGVSNIDLLYTEGVAAVATHVFNPTMKTLILPPTLGDSAGVFGAAMLCA
ncbi:MAG: ROK family protein [Bacteroidia bacterium]